MATDKQIKSRRRNFMIMYLKGMITMLKLLQKYTKAWYLTKDLHVLETQVTSLLDRLKWLKDNNPDTYLDHFNSK